MTHSTSHSRNRSSSLGDEHFDAQLECFYTGTSTHWQLRHTVLLRSSARRSDPAEGVIPTIIANDSTHLVFDEPDNYGRRGDPTFIGPMNLSNLVLQRPHLLWRPKPRDRQSHQHRGMWSPGDERTARSAA